MKVKNIKSVILLEKFGHHLSRRQQAGKTVNPGGGSEVSLARREFSKIKSLPLKRAIFNGKGPKFAFFYQI